MQGLACRAAIRGAREDQQYARLFQQLRRFEQQNQQQRHLIAEHQAQLTQQAQAAEAAQQAQQAQQQQLEQLQRTMQELNERWQRQEQEQEYVWLVGV
jgi:predicted  nucleic acid-binding Zn-ribbon protein